MVVAFATFKGGVGKSSLCVNVAAQWARAGRRVCVLDLDRQQDALAFFQTLGEMGVFVLAANASNLRELLALAKRQGAICLLDTNPSAAPELVLALAEADYVLAPFNEEPAYKNLALLHQAVEGAREQNPKLQVLYALTIQDRRLGVFGALEDVARKELGSALLGAKMHNLAPWKEAAWEKQDVETFIADHEATREVRAFAVELWEKINDNTTTQ